MKGNPDAGTQKPLTTLIETKDGPTRVLHVKNHTITVNINGIHNVMSIYRITLLKTAGEAMQATEVKRRDDIQLKAGSTGDENIVEQIVRH